MNKDSAKPCQSPAVRRRKINSSQTQQSPQAAKDGRTRARKGKASPDKETPKKRKRVSKAKPCNTSEEGVGVKRGKSTSSSTDTRRESSSSLLEGCSTSLAPRGVKRGATADGEGPTREKIRSVDLKETKEEIKEDFTSSVEACRAKFEAKYEQGNQLGEGGCGSVFAGYRKADNLPVAIKHVPNDKVFCKQVDKNGNQLSVEVAVMLKLGMTESAVSLLDWYDLDEELILVLERPIPSVDLFTYNEINGGRLEEEEAKIILKQLLDATVELQDKNIFHRDIKTENILIETGADVPRVRLIDFGLSCFVKRGSSYRIFYGTSCHIPPEWYSCCVYRAGPTTVWQLGVVLYEILHRKSSFETREFLGNKLKISNKLSNECQDFLQNCLTKVPERRPTLEQLQHHPWLR
ncbi:serine/threonine-protein kinase pim-1-like isoform X1 [Thunnus albacares]|uniref:serine/threonine-protein kinase pim-1-like isoform X1 n=1 Tax=Thunnus albacares TaxID=8236 RepID=UPI001CF67FE6|nr:serine/threonine-protein kinase pim-1-like isoform X1 [Thunnus albacares]